MIESFLVRLSRTAYKDGKLAGQVRIVATGQGVMVRNEKELLHALTSHLGGGGEASPEGADQQQANTDQRGGSDGEGDGQPPDWPTEASISE